jgi:hypothetical protein
MSAITSSIVPPLLTLKRLAEKLLDLAFRKLRVRVVWQTAWEAIRCGHLWLSTALAKSFVPGGGLLLLLHRHHFYYFLQ